MDTEKILQEAQSGPDWSSELNGHLEISSNGKILDITLYQGDARTTVSMVPASWYLDAKRMIDLMGSFLDSMPCAWTETFDPEDVRFIDSYETH